MISDPIGGAYPEKEKVRQEGRRFKLPNEPMFTITVTDKHGVICGYIRRLMLECQVLAGVYRRAVQQGMQPQECPTLSFASRQNAVTTNVIEAGGLF